MMLQDTDAIELRALQAKAYGRGGGLTDTDAARLRELESRRAETPTVAASERTTTVEAPVVDSIDVPHAVPAGASASAEDVSPGEPDEGAATDGGDVSAGSLRQTVRRHWKTALAASAVLLAIGLGTGWALFGRASEISLTPEQQDRRAELQAEGEYDPGSLRAIGQDEDALVWYATKGDGDMICLTIDVTDESANQCQQADDLQNGTGIGIGVTVVSEGTEDGGPQQVWATAARATTGEIVAIIQRWSSAPDDWLSQFAGEERVRAEQLVEQGFQEYSFSIVGYFQDAPVWFGQRLDGALVEDCLVVDSIDARNCASAGEAQETGGTISISGVVAGEGDGASEPWSITLAFTSAQTPYLVITGDAAAASRADAQSGTVAPGEVLELGGEYQDPIEVEVPSDDPDS